MLITKDAVVSFHYTLSNQAGEEVESTRGEEPSLCLIGADNILPGLEQAMMNKQSGDSFNITLEPYLAYGMYQDSKKDRISAKYLKHEGKLKPGKVVKINTNQGFKTGTILKVGKFSVDVDMNHPLAGQSISFEIAIINVRPGTVEEVTHGHAHGVGGHQH